MLNSKHEETGLSAMRMSEVMVCPPGESPVQGLSLRVETWTSTSPPDKKRVGAGSSLVFKGITEFSDCTGDGTIPRDAI